VLTAEHPRSRSSRQRPVVRQLLVVRQDLSRRPVSPPNGQRDHYCSIGLEAAAHRARPSDQARDCRFSIIAEAAEPYFGFHPRESAAASG
jgi:hypothetical protein